MTLPAFRLAELGQSIWYDNISRDLLEDGELARLIAEQGVRGVTSNPTIFQKAMSASPAYTEQFEQLVATTRDPQAIYEALAISDIQAGADLLRSVHDDSGGEDGFISLEVAPALAHDTEATIAEARRLWAAVDRPNLMIKVPATPEGVPAIRALIGDGINVNVTLIFSRAAYAQVIDAYLSGLEDRAARGDDVSGVRSVASFFVSRVDTAVDRTLDALAESKPESADDALALRGRAAVANAKLAYALYEDQFTSERFGALREKGAHEQRPLWASTSTKNPSYPDLLYVETLIGPNTVNTLPPATLTALNDHGRIEETVRDGVDGARELFASLEGLDVHMEAVFADLLSAGVASFAKSYDDLIAAVRQRCESVPTGSGA